MSAWTELEADRAFDIPLEQICATTEPRRAARFDKRFRPAPLTRCRWLSMWKAEHRAVVEAS